MLCIHDRALISGHQYSDSMLPVDKPNSKNLRCPNVPMCIHCLRAFMTRCPPPPQGFRQNGDFVRLESNTSVLYNSLPGTSP